MIVNSWLTDDEARRISRSAAGSAIASPPGIPDVPGEPRDVEELARSSRRGLISRGSCSWVRTGITSSSCSRRPTGSATSPPGVFFSGDQDAGAAFLRLYRQLDSHRLARGARPTERRRRLRPRAMRGDRRTARQLRARNARLGQHCLAGSARAKPLLRRPPEEGPATITLPPRSAATGRVGCPSAGVHEALLARRALMSHAFTRLDRTTSRAFMPTDASFAVYSATRRRGAPRDPPGPKR